MRAEVDSYRNVLMFRTRSNSLLCCLLLWAAGTGQYAMAAVVPQQEYTNYIDQHRTVEARTNSPFGEEINLRDGSLQLRMVDFELPGTGPAIRLVRTFHVNEAAKTAETSGNTLGDWDLEIPRIKTITANALGTRGNSPYGWQVPGVNKDARCSNFAAPGAISFWDAARHWEPEEWWNGYQLVDGMGRSQEMLQVIGTYPEVAGYKAVTNGNWRFSCLPSTANGMPGEGFLAMDPDGNRYWFDYLIYTNADTLSKALWTVPAPFSGPHTGSGVAVQPKSSAQDHLPRRYASLMVSRVEDRFGNWVSYQYSGDVLVRILASDGRELNISRASGLVTARINTGGYQRLWRYLIAGAQPNQNLRGTLTQVLLPDGSSWSYDFSRLSSAGTLWEPSMSLDMCEKQDIAIQRTIQGVATAPSGVLGSFSLVGRGFGRSNVPRECWGGSGANYSGYALVPAGWAGYALKTRTLSGPGITPATWNYDYSASNASWSTECVVGCVNEVWTDVVDPAGTRRRSVFSNRFDDSENLLLREEITHPDGTLLRRVSHGYASSAVATNWPWPAVLGSDMQSRTNQARNSTWVPIRTTKVEQQGDIFYYQVNDYDRFANPVSVRRWSSLGYDRTDLTDYLHDTTRWVLGRIKRVVNVNTGLVSSRIDYDSATVLPIQIHQYGKLQQTLSYHADGNLARFKDGRDLLTSVGNWYRGVPRNIQFADGSTQSADVDDNGWIRSVTDENGFATGYGYDAMGRLAGIAYPVGDTVNWQTTTSTFQQIDAVEYGIAAGHWRQTIQTGNGYKVTYFDGLWRPLLIREYDAGNITATERFQRYTYDHEGRITFAAYPANISNSNVGTWTSYDPLGRVTSVGQDSELSPSLLVTTTDYLTGLQTRTTNPRGHQTTQGYVAYDTPSYEQMAWSVQPEGKVIEITRNIFGSPTRLRRRDTNSTQIVDRHYVYDTHQQLCKTIEPETSSSVMEYDAAGNLAWTAAGLSLPDPSACNRSEAWSSGRRAERSYDARNRLLSLSFPDG